MAGNARLHYFSGILCTFHVVQSIIVGFYQLFACTAKTFRRQVCFCIIYLVLSVNNKINSCSLLYRLPNLPFRLLSLL